MMNNYVRTATAEEIAIYEKVERAFENADLFDEVFDLLDEEEMADLLANRVKGESLKAILKACDLTEKEFCVWYFAEEA